MVEHEDIQEDSSLWTEADYSMPVIAKFGTGGGNTPLVIKRLAMWCIGNGKAHQWQLQNNVGALNCMHDQQIILGGRLKRTLLDD